MMMVMVIMLSKHRVEIKYKDNCGKGEKEVLCSVGGNGNGRGAIK